MAIDPEAFIHPLALVEDGAVVGRGSKVWPFSQVRPGAVIGEDTNIAKNVFVDGGAVIGDRCKVANNVSVHDGITIGNEVFVGMGTVFTNDRYPRAVSPDWVLLHTTVGDGASLGANVSVAPGTTIGSYAMVGLGSTVTRDVEAHELVAGNPAKHLGWVCRCGKVAAKTEERPDDLRCEDCKAAGVPEV